MLDLGQVRIWIAVIDQSIEKLRSLPYALLAFIQAEVLLLFRKNIVERLMFVIQPVKLRDPRVRLRVILPELFLGLTFLIASRKELIPLVHVFQWSVNRI